MFSNGGHEFEVVQEGNISLCIVNGRPYHGEQRNLNMSTRKGVVDN